jgi:hypothetical protein
MDPKLGMEGDLKNKNEAFFKATVYGIEKET